MDKGKERSSCRWYKAYDVDQGIGNTQQEQIERENEEIERH
jgi:hypothetical protein